jgi:hypothetical protein
MEHCSVRAFSVDTPRVQVVAIGQACRLERAVWGDIVKTPSHQ